MKPLFCALMLLACTGSIAQTPVPEFGIFTPEEKALTECPYDKEADAIVLIDQASSDHDDQYRLITTRRVRIKILKEKGIGYADVEIPFRHADDFEYVSNINAVACNSDESGNHQVQKVPNSQIYRKKISDYRSAIKIAMPGVKVGSIFEYQYTITAKTYGGLDDWYFQRDIPTKLSSYSLVILPNYEFAYKVHKSPNLPIDIKSDNSSGRVRFEMKDVAGLRNEPYMDAKRDYIQRVEFQLAGYRGTFGDKKKYMTTWNEVVRELMSESYFGRQLNKNLGGSSELMLKVKAIISSYEKMTTIYRYVQNNISWDGYTGKYSENVKTAWEKRKGSNADINLILINLLQEAGLDAYPLLVSERGNGKVDENYPFIDQFNTVMAYVVIGKDKYVLDGASYFTPPTTIPFSVVNTTAFIVDRKKGGIVKLSESRKKDKNLVSIIATLDQNGALSGKGMILSYDYARINRERAYRRDKARFAEEYYMRNVPGLQIDSLKVTNLDNDSMPLSQQFDFTMPATKTGDYQLLTLNLFSGLEKNPFISDNRFTNIDYGALQYLVINGTINLPADMQPETLPRDIKLIMPDTSISITRLMSYNKSINTVSARYVVQTDRSVFPPDEYPAVKEFYKKMTDILNEQIVLRKKAATKP